MNGGEKTKFMFADYRNHDASIPLCHYGDLVSSAVKPTGFAG